MSNIPATLKYSEDHEWIRDNGDGTVTIGITDHAQQLLGDLVYVELPDEEHYDQKEVCGVVESVKAASDVYSPVSGDLIKANEQLEDQPEIVNDDPYNAGWIAMIKLDDNDENITALMDASAYRTFCNED